MMHRAVADPPPIAEPDEVGPPEADAPGVLRGDVWLTVQSWHAQRLISGRGATLDKPAIIGLVGFADRLRVIWNAARADDPYADWWLIKIDAALKRARQRIKQECEALDTLIKTHSTLRISVAGTDKPYRVQLQFANPYAYWGAHVVAEFDTAARTILTARHVGLISGADAEASLRGCSGAIRALFAVPQGYRVYRINRDAVAHGEDAAKSAAERMGELPSDVLSGEHVAALAPRRARS